MAALLPLAVSWIASRMRTPMPISGSDRLFWIPWIIIHVSLQLCRRGSVVRSVGNTQFFLLQTLLPFQVLMIVSVNVSGKLIVIVIDVWFMLKILISLTICV
jgi:hypothetical protein